MASTSSRSASCCFSGLGNTTASEADHAPRPPDDSSSCVEQPRLAAAHHRVGHREIGDRSHVQVWLALPEHDGERLGLRAKEYRRSVVRCRALCFRGVATFVTRTPAFGTDRARGRDARATRALEIARSRAESVRRHRAFAHLRRPHDARLESVDGFVECCCPAGRRTWTAYPLVVVRVRYPVGPSQPRNLRRAGRGRRAAADLPTHYRLAGEHLSWRATDPDLARAAAR